MSESFVLTRLLVKLFGGILAAGFHAVGLPAEKASEQASAVLSAFSLELLIAAGLIAFFVLVRATLSVEKPGVAQQRHTRLRGPAQLTLPVVGAMILHEPVKSPLPREY